jgi:hypothetical protein
MNVSELKEGLRVRWNPNVAMIPVGIGTVRGIATMELPLMGSMTIIQVDEYVGGFSCVSIQSSMLEKINEP